MAGNVRQPIDVASLERYIAANVPEIAVPVDVKQVRGSRLNTHSQANANSRLVWLWTVQPNLPTDR